MSIPTHSQKPSSRLRHAVLVCVLAFATSAAGTMSEDLDLGRAAVEAGRFADAVDVLSPLCAELGATADDQGRCWFYLGVAWQRLAAGADDSQTEDRRRRAVAAYEALLGFAGKTKLSFSLAPAHNNLARLHAELGNSERADTAYEKAVELADDTRRAAYLESHADFLAAGGDWQGAAEKYRSVVILAPASESAHRKLLEHYRIRDLEGLVEYLRRLLRAGQVLRVRDAALSVLAEDEAPRALREELLVLVALALSHEVYDPRSFPQSEAAERLRTITDDPEIGEGAREILLLHGDGGGQPGIYAWWASTDAADKEASAIGRREAFRELARAIGRWYQIKGDGEVAEKSYRLAGDLVPGESDPEATKALADLYLERGEVDRLQQLLAEYEPRLQNDVDAATVSDEAVLGYRETASRILLHLGEYGDGTEPASAFYQLRRTADLANALDRRDRERPKFRIKYGEFEVGLAPPRFDPRLAERWVSVLVAQGKVERANEVRLGLTAGYRESGHALAAYRLLQTVEPETLTPSQLASYQELRPADAGKSAQDLYAAGAAYFEAKDFAAASAHLEGALALAPSLFEAKIGIAAVHVERGEYDLVLQISDEVLSRDPSNLSALSVRYHAFARMGAAEEAAQTLSRWTDALAESHSSSAVASEATAEQVAAGNPDTELPADAERILLRGVSFFNLGDVERAMVMFERSLSLDPAHGLAHYYLGLSEFQTGDSVSALEHLRHFLELEPDHPESARARELLAGAGS